MVLSPSPSPASCDELQRLETCLAVLEYNPLNGQHFLADGKWVDLTEAYVFGRICFLRPLHEVLGPRAVRNAAESGQWRTPPSSFSGRTGQERQAFGQQSVTACHRSRSRAGPSQCVTRSQTRSCVARQDALVLNVPVVPRTASVSERTFTVCDEKPRAVCRCRAGRSCLELPSCASRSFCQTEVASKKSVVASIKGSDIKVQSSSPVAASTVCCTEVSSAEVLSTEVLSQEMSSPCAGRFMQYTPPKPRQRWSRKTLSSSCSDDPTKIVNQKSGSGGICQGKMTSQLVSAKQTHGCRLLQRCSQCDPHDGAVLTGHISLSMPKPSAENLVGDLVTGKSGSPSKAEAAQAATPRRTRLRLF